jgi:nitroreductase
MQTIEAILSRRSIRKFTPEIPSDTQIIEVLKAAMYAPSARNQQLWSFIVISDRTLLNELSAISPSLALLEYAPMAIAVCGDLRLAKSPDYWQTDCAAATQNILLAAHELGLGTVWMGVFPRENRVIPISKLLEIPENVFPFSLIAIGTPAEQPTQPERFLPERIFKEKWGK